MFEILTPKIPIKLIFNCVFKEEFFEKNAWITMNFVKTVMPSYWFSLFDHSDLKRNYDVISLLQFMLKRLGRNSINRFLKKIVTCFAVFSIKICSFITSELIKKKFLVWWPCNVIRSFLWYYIAHSCTFRSVIFVYLNWNFMFYIPINLIHL